MTNLHPNDTPRIVREWQAADANNLDKITKAQALLSLLLALAVALLAAGLILGVLGYNSLSDKVENIEDSTAATAVQPTP